MTRSSAARPAAVSPPYPPLYTPFKMVSLRLVPALRDSRLSSNTVTVTWAVLLVTASVAVAYGRVVLGFALVLVAVLLDCIDGDLARCRSRPSVLGTLLEQLAHWIGNMCLMAAAGAGLVLADPRPRNVLLGSTLTVVQAVYIAVVRQIRPDAANIPEQPRVRRVFRWIVRVFWLVSPIELPLVGALAVFGVAEGVVLVITVTLAVSSALIFVPHFILIRAADRKQWVTTECCPDSFADRSRRRAEAILTRLPEAHWWAPGVPRLPPEVLAFLGRQPMASGAPVIESAWRDLAEALPRLFRTSGRALPLACPDELALEAVVGTICRSEDQIMVVGGRATVRRWRTVAERLGVRVSVLEVPFGASLQRSALETAIARCPGQRAVCLPLADTEDGTLTDLPTVAEVLRGLPALVVVDACLSLCIDELRMDEWGVDIAVSSSDSGVMAPPGLSLIAMGTRAIEALEESSASVACPGTYLDLRAHLAETDRPLVRLPAPALLGLRLSVQMILAAGMDVVLAHRQRLAERFRRRCVEDAGFVLVAARPTSACTSVLAPPDVRLVDLQEALFTTMRMVVGYGSAPDGRITLHFGHAGWLFHKDIDDAAFALASAVLAVRTGTDGD